MVKNPSDRYSNIKELIEDLDYFRSAEVMKADSRHRQDKPIADVKDFKVESEIRDLKNQTRLLEKQAQRFLYLTIALLIGMVLETLFFFFMYG